MNFANLNMFKASVTPVAILLMLPLCVANNGHAVTQNDVFSPSYYDDVSIKNVSTNDDVNINTGIASSLDFKTNRIARGSSLLLASSQSLSSDELKLPELGSGGNRFIESNQHKALGEWSIQRINGSAHLLTDPWSQTLLERLAWQINSLARTQSPLALVVLNDSAINAFAIPGGVMGINTGTVIEANSMDEVASVIAHEVAHLSQRHYENRGDADVKALMIKIGGLIAAIAAAAADGDAATAIMMGSQTAALNSQMAFSRSNEREADRIGMQLMAKSGYDPRAMPRFFATLNQKQQLNISKQAYLPSFIMSHPLSSERLSEAKSRANSYDTLGLASQHSPVEFDLLKWRLKVLTKQADEVEIRSAAENSVGATLALVHWLAAQGEYAQAQQLLTKLHSSQSMTASLNAEVELLLAITEAQVAGMQGQWQRAETILQPYYRVYPERRDVKLYLTEIWLQLGKYQDVIATLKPLLKQRPHDIQTLTRLQYAYELMANNNTDMEDKNAASTTMTNTMNKTMRKIATIHTLRYRSQAEMWQAQYDEALTSLGQAKNIAKALNRQASTFNITPILALIENDIKAVKTAKDFTP